MTIVCYDVRPYFSRSETISHVAFKSSPSPARVALRDRKEDDLFAWIYSMVVEV
jgi:hypothetical protein